VTWTVDEGHALSRVLTPGKDSRNDYISYTHNFSAISRKMRKGCPALQAKRLGAYWTTTIGGKSVVVFKSDSHMSQDGPQLPNIDVWTQIITEVRPKLVITTGTAGGIGTEVEVGDVVCSPIVRFDCRSKFKNKPFFDSHYSSNAAQTKYFATAKKLFAANAAQLPKDNKRPPKILRAAPSALRSSVVTTDFFGFDTSNNRYKLQGLGKVSEMGDAVLGLVATQLGSAAPRWLAIQGREAEATAIPTEVTVDVDGFEVGRQFAAGEIVLPAGTTLAGDPEQLILIVSEAPTADTLDAEVAASEADLGIVEDKPVVAPEAE